MEELGFVIICVRIRTTWALTSLPYVKFKIKLSPFKDGDYYLSCHGITFSNIAECIDAKCYFVFVKALSRDPST